MPSTGTPSSRMPGSAKGASDASTLDGPPESTMPRGAQARIASSGMWQGWISQYTPRSRMRRAISCVYWLPKSRTSTRSRWASADIGAPPPLLEPIVRGLAGDHHVVDVALLQRRLRDAHEARLLAQLGEVRRAAVAHARAQAAEQLVDAAGEAAPVGHAALDALGHELGRLDVVLEVAVARALGHRAERAHAAVELVGAALVEDGLARRLVGAREQRADHHARGAGGERLHGVARELDPAVRDHRHVEARRHARGVDHRGELGH